MQKNKIEILSTKRLDKAIDSDDIVIDEIPFIETRGIDDGSVKKKIQQLSGQQIHAIFTSRNAAEMVGKYVAKNEPWKIYCTGDKTKDTILHFFPCAFIATVAENAADLAWIILKDISVKSVIFFCGNQRRDELPEILVQNGIDMEEVMVYETISRPVTITKEYDGVLFFSPSAVESFFSKNKLNDNTICFAVGNTTAHAIEKFSGNKIITAVRATQQSILDAVLATFNLLNK
ncbi:MAG TPA: uroporphyrinogen-III synthase [Chitinophagaceae bacterium]|nr:uroporphyrinogen-III synthase [Chitinophagaceae bacterium]